jgi:hypothetical protein
LVVISDFYESEEEDESEEEEEKKKVGCAYVLLEK